MIVIYHQYILYTIKMVVNKIVPKKPYYFSFQDLYFCVFVFLNLAFLYANCMFLYKQIQFCFNLNF